MVVEKKQPLEKNRNLLGQKQRKVSKSNKQICSPAYGNGPPLFPTELDPPPDPVVSWVQNLQIHPQSPVPNSPEPLQYPPSPLPPQHQNKTAESHNKASPASRKTSLQHPRKAEQQKAGHRKTSLDQHGSPVLGSQTPPATKSKEQGKELKSSETGKTTGGNGDGDCVSMESMVNLPSTALEAHYRAGLAHLKAGKFNEAIKSLETVKKGVEEGAHYGEYVIYKRTVNKRTTLSALCMFLALAWEGLASPRKAIECCSSSIQHDPGWPVPFSKRSEYFALFEQLLLDMDGSSKEEASRRLGANIIVDPSWVSSSSSSGEGGSTSSVGKEGCRRFSDLQEGLSAAKEGDVVYLEQGFYFREEGFTVHCSVTLIGNSTRGVQLVSKGAPTLQVCCTGATGRAHIQLQRLQFRNKWGFVRGSEDEDETMQSSAAHIYVISAASVTVRDCLFPGGEEGAGGVLVAEEAFYQSLLDLECQNPELRGSSGGVEGGSLRLLMDFCIFSDIRVNAAVHSNNQAVVVLSNCEVRDCGGAGLKAEEGSTLNLLNCQVQACGSECVAVDTISRLNVRGSLLASSGTRSSGRAKYKAGVSLSGRSHGTVARSLLRHHPSAVSCDDSDLLLEESCVMDISTEEGGSNASLELKHSAVFVRQAGSVIIKGNNFHNCNLVFLLQHGASPTITNNNVETCLIGFICGARAHPKVEKNLFHCILMSIGMFIEDSRGTVTNNIFQYVANGLDVHRGSSPRMSSNTYTRLAVPGLSGSLSFDIQRVHSGKLEELEAAEIITFNGDTEEEMAAAALSRRQATQERERPCPCCGEVRSRPIACTRCGQISYCGEDCLVKDSARHRTFCGISLKDMF